MYSILQQSVIQHSLSANVRVLTSGLMCLPTLRASLHLCWSTAPQPAHSACVQSTLLHTQPCTSTDCIVSAVSHQKSTYKALAPSIQQAHSENTTPYWQSLHNYNTHLAGKQVLLSHMFWHQYTTYHHTTRNTTVLYLYVALVQITSNFWCFMEYVLLCGIPKHQ